MIVTPIGPKVIARFPANELLIGGRSYVRYADFVRAADQAVAPAGVADLEEV